MEAAWEDTMRTTSFAPNEPYRDFDHNMMQKRMHNIELSKDL